MKKILVVDDDPEIVDLVKNRLEAHNYAVVTALNGEEALQKTKEQSPNLIILDIAMPKMDGYTFVLELRRKDELKTIPIVLLTAKDKMKGIFEMEGVYHYFIKPFVSEKLLATLKNILGE